MFAHRMISLFTASSLVTMALAGCVPVVVGGAAATGVAVAQERSVGTAIDDTSILTQINAKFLGSKIQDLITHVDIKVNEGAVLLTGNVKHSESSIEAVKLAWQVNGVKEVINEIQVTDRASFKDFAKDTWITAQAKSRLLAEKNLKSINYNVETVNAVVYLIGIAQNPEELEKAVYIASRVKGVEKVISHVRLKDDPRRQ